MRKNMRKKTFKFTQATSGSYAFLWTVAEKGYNLLDKSTHKPCSDSIEEVDGHSPWLMPQDGGGHLYAPLSQQRTLHRKFACLYSEDSIISFAKQYGTLGRDVLLMPCSGGVVVPGESLERWRHESRTMGVLLAIWDMVEKRDAGKLGQIIIWRPNDRYEVRVQSSYDDAKRKWQISQYKGGDPQPGCSADVVALTLRGIYHSELLERWQKSRGSVIEPAKYYVCREVNKRLEGHVAPKILPFVNDKIYLFPDSLLAALWVMFLMEITGNIRIRQCDLCGEWKEVALTRSSVYCSNTCRQKAYYKRHKQQKGINQNERTYRKEG